MPYSGNPGASDSDAVRFLIQDTNPTAPLFLDAEISYFLAQQPSPLRAAADAARTLAARYAAQIDAGGGSLRRSASQRHKQYLTIEAELRARSDRQDAAPWAAGISKADKAVMTEDTDAIEPDFTRALFDVPGTVPPTGQSNLA